MTIGSSSRSRTARMVALGVGAFLLLPAPLAVASSGEPAPPGPRPPVPRTVLARPGTHARPLTGAPSLPRSLSARSWLVADAGTGEVLAARDAHRRLPPASTLKSLFALTAMPQLEASARHKVTARELAGVGEGSSLVGVTPGHTYRVADLWRGVFLNSGNDAVHVLSSMIGGQRATVRQMQAKAKALGARDTHVVSPDGYDMPGQVSSAYDLAVFGRAGLADPEFAKYCSTAVARFPGDHGSYGIQNTNRLLTGADGVDRYQGMVGVKNGYTTQAGNTLIAAAHRHGRTILVTVMHPDSGERFAVYQEAESLLNWGFSAADQVRPVGSLLPDRHTAPPTARAAGATADLSAAASGKAPNTGSLAAEAPGAAGLLAVGVVVAVRRRKVWHRRV